MLASPHPPRHALLRVAPSAWAAVLAQRPDLAGEPLLASWAARSYPLVARRRLAEDPADEVAAGLPLPPACGKRRVAVTLRREGVRAIDPPPPLTLIRPIAPEAWSATIGALESLGQRIGCQPRVFGSFAWGALTGLDYVTPASDLDLLWAATAATDLDALLSGLARLEQGAPGRLDGEIVLEASGAAVNWRELHGGSREILVKTSEAVMLRPRAWFLKALAGAA